MNTRWTPRRQYLFALVGSSLVSIGFFGYGAWRNHSLTFDYLIWNLFLAWLPLLFAVRLAVMRRTKPWSSWEGIVYSTLWLIFLPNSFYMISDFIHLQSVQRVDIIYDTLMFTAFIYTAAVLGFTSLYIMHQQFRRRLPAAATQAWIAGVLLICSSAIYVGRDLRWNSWDVLTNPGGLLFDVSDRLLHPTSYPHMLQTIITFFILLGTMYLLVLSSIRAMQAGTDRHLLH